MQVGCHFLYQKTLKWGQVDITSLFHFHSTTILKSKNTSRAEQCRAQKLCSNPLNNNFWKSNIVHENITFDMWLKLSSTKLEKSINCCLVWGFEIYLNIRTTQFNFYQRQYLHQCNYQDTRNISLTIFFPALLGDHRTPTEVRDKNNRTRLSFLSAIEQSIIR